MGVADTPLSEFAAQLAARTPAPGGGAAAAAATALAAGLVEMAAQFTLSRVEYESVHPRAGKIAASAQEARTQALQLIERDLEAYAPVLEAMALPRADPAREGRIRTASIGAAIPPLEIAKLAAEVAELGAELVSIGNRNLLGDAMTGALLAEAACQSAVTLVGINVSGSCHPEAGEIFVQTTPCIARAQRARAQVLG